MSNAHIPPIVPVPEGSQSDGFDDVEPLVGERDAPLDPDADADQVDSAEADERAAREGTRDGDLER